MTTKTKKLSAQRNIMENRKMASFAVRPYLIERALDMPDGHTIVGCEWDFASRTVRLYVEGPDMPEVEPDQMVPSIVPCVTVTLGDNGEVVSRTWDWTNKSPAIGPQKSRTLD